MYTRDREFINYVYSNISISGIGHLLRKLRKERELIKGKVAIYLSKKGHLKNDPVPCTFSRVLYISQLVAITHDPYFLNTIPFPFTPLIRFTILLLLLLLLLLIVISINTKYNMFFLRNYATRSRWMTDQN